MTLLAVLSGLMAALAWGSADFVGGLASRRAMPARIVLVSQLVGTTALVLFGLWRGETLPPPRDLALGGVAGLFGGTGLMLLYMSLARGVMGLVAPLTAVASGGIPLLAGLLTAGLPGAAQLGGFLLALGAIWIIARTGHEPIRPGDLFLPLLAGVGFGVFLGLIGLVGQGVGFFGPLVAARAVSISVMAAIVMWSRSNSRGAPESAAGVGFPWLPAALAGLGDISGNILYVYSAQVGRLDVAAVLGALYPAVTVLLARLVLGERLTRRQNAGVALALAAVALIAL